MGAGPFARLCLGIVVPGSMAIGAVSGAVVGAVRADSAASVESKRELLTAMRNPPTAGLGAAERIESRLQASARLGTVHAADAQTVFSKHYLATSTDKLTTAEWRDNDTQRAREGLDGMVTAIVNRMVADLRRQPAPDLPPPVPVASPYRRPSP